MRLRDAFARDIPWEQQRFDYGARTDGQPEYYGHARITYADTDAHWVIFKYTYNDDGYVILIQARVGAWSARSTLF